METTASPLSHPWTQAVQLSCVICGAQAEPGPSWTGCKTCQGPVVADYSAVEGQPDDLLREVRLAEQGPPSAGTGAPPP